jgi:hypothetical protein
MVCEERCPAVSVNQLGVDTAISSLTARARQCFKFGVSERSNANYADEIGFLASCAESERHYSVSPHLVHTTPSHMSTSYRSECVLSS